MTAHRTVIEAPRVYVRARCCGHLYRRWTYVDHPWPVGLGECPHCVKPLHWIGSDNQTVDIDQPGQAKDASQGRTRGPDLDPTRRRRSPDIDAPPRLTQAEQLEARAAELRAQHATADVVRQCLIERDITLIDQQLTAAVR